MTTTVISNGVTPTNGLSKDITKDNRPITATVQNNANIKISNSHNSLVNPVNTANMNRSNSNHNNLSNNINTSLVNRPSLIEYKNYRFLIMDAPTESNIHAYIDILKRKNVIAVVRACEPTYQIDTLLRNNIKVLEAAFPDGDPPSEHIINDWLALVKTMFNDNTNTGNTPKSKQLNDLKTTPQGTTPNGTVATESDSDKKAIAVHCVAGLGRAPVLVAIALIEAGMQPIEVIDFIRKRRRGAFNSKQLKYIQSYKPRSNGNKKGDCSIM